MEDSKPIIPSGSATPYLAVFNGSSKPIMDPKSGLPVGALVTNFSYEYNEDDDDKFEITIECDNPNLIDEPELANQMPLVLQWGWIYSDGSSSSGPVRQVVIRDSSMRLSQNGVSITLKGTDPFAMTKQTPADLEDKILVQWIKNNIEGKFAIDIIDYNSVMVTKFIRRDEETGKDIVFHNLIEE